MKVEEARKTTEKAIQERRKKEDAIDQAKPIFEQKMSEPIIAYKLSRPECGGWIGGLKTAQEVADCLKSELEVDISEGFNMDERTSFEITPYVTTQKEIDELPEFGGW